MRQEASFTSEGEYLSDDFKSGLMLSLALHVFFVILAFIIGRIFSPASPANATLEILRASVRVDVVGMPKMTIQELKALQTEAQAPKEEPKPAQATKTEVSEAPPKPNDVVIQEQGKEVKKSFTSLLNDYSKKAPTAKAEKKGDSKGKSDGLDALILEGNRLSKGTALVGDVSDTADAPFVGYAQTLPDLIRNNWRLPSFLKDKNYQCRIHIWIGAQGQLLKAEMRESSGNEDYDERALSAIRASSPFPAPPAEAQAKLAHNGLILGFPL